MTQIYFITVMSEGKRGIFFNFATGKAVTAAQQHSEDEMLRIFTGAGVALRRPKSEPFYRQDLIANQGEFTGFPEFNNEWGCLV